MAEKIVKLSKEAVEAVKTFGGDRNESVESTLGRLIGTGAALAKEVKRGAKVFVEEPDGTRKEVPLP